MWIVKYTGRCCCSCCCCPQGNSQHHFNSNTASRAEQSMRKLGQPKNLLFDQVFVVVLGVLILFLIYFALIVKVFFCFFKKRFYYHFVCKSLPHFPNILCSHLVLDFCSFVCNSIILCVWFLFLQFTTTCRLFPKP